MQWIWAPFLSNRRRRVQFIIHRDCSMARALAAPVHHWFLLLCNANLCSIIPFATHLPPPECEMKLSAAAKGKIMAIDTQHRFWRCTRNTKSCSVVHWQPIKWACNKLFSHLQMIWIKLLRLVFLGFCAFKRAQGLNVCGELCRPCLNNDGIAHSPNINSWHSMTEAPFLTF